MCDYSKFWDELIKIPQKDTISELKGLFDRYGLLNEDDTPKETLHFELKRWENGYLRNKGDKGGKAREKLVEEIVAIANTIIRHPLETGILVVGIDEDKKLTELPHIDEKRIDKSRLLNKKIKDIKNEFVNPLIGELHRLTIPEFPSGRLKCHVLFIERNEEQYPIVFFKIPVVLKEFFGIKSGSDSFTYCMKFRVRNKIKEEEKKGSKVVFPEKIQSPLLYLLRNIHKGVAFDIFTNFGRLKEPLFELSSQEPFKILDEKLPLDPIELELLVGLDTRMDKKTFIEYLEENGLIKKMPGGKWAILLTALLLFGQRHLQIQEFQLPKIKVAVKLEETKAEGESNEEVFENPASSFAPQQFLLFPLRKCLSETFGFINEVLDKVEEICYDWEDFLPILWEILLNAIMHMNYCAKSPQIEIVMSEEYVEISNPTLWDLRGLPIEKLCSPNFPKPNKNLYNFVKGISLLDTLERASQVLREESFYSIKKERLHGLSNVLEYSLSKGFPLPNFYFNNQKFKVRLNALENQAIRDFYKSCYKLPLPALIYAYIFLFEKGNQSKRFNEFFEGDLPNEEKEHVREILNREKLM